jgi:hypothetical protein
MNDPTSLPLANRLILQRLNALILERIGRLFTRRLTGARFRNLLPAEEGLEVAGLDVFDVQQPTEHLDLGRLRVPWEHLPLALANEEVVCKRFERVAEEHFVILADVSASMRYPLRLLYAGLPLEQIDRRLRLSDLLAGKPTLLKLVVGGFARLAAASGFLVRLVTFGAALDEGELLRRQDVVPPLLERLDRCFLGRARPAQAATLYEEVAARYLDHKAVFLFVGDFAGDDLGEAGRRSWRRTLGLCRQWGIRRRVLFVRVAHQAEVMDPARLPYGAVLQNPWADRCDLSEEVLAAADPATLAGGEETSKAAERLHRQRAWSAVLARSLRPSYLEVERWPSGWLEREVRRLWPRLVGR